MKTLIRLYAGQNKQQRKNYISVPAGTDVKVLYRGKDTADGSEFCLVQFLINGVKFYTRCAPHLIE